MKNTASSHRSAIGVRWSSPSRIGLCAHYALSLPKLPTNDEELSSPPQAPSEMAGLFRIIRGLRGQEQYSPLFPPAIESSGRNARDKPDDRLSLLKGITGTGALFPSVSETTLPEHGLIPNSASRLSSWRAASEGTADRAFETDREYCSCPHIRSQRAIGFARRPFLPCKRSAAGEVARERVRSAKPRDGGGQHYGDRLSNVEIVQLR